MSDWEIVRRPKLEPHRADGVDPNTDWRRFVLEQVGYDEVARDRAERRMLRREALRRFCRALIGGLALYALAFVVVLAALCWREGRFDRYMPHEDAPAETPVPHWTRETPPPASEVDAHVVLQNPFDRPVHPRASSDDVEGGDASQPDAAPAADTNE